MSVSPTRETGGHSPQTTVAECAQRCFESFQHCLDSASKSDKLSAPWSKLSLVRIEDQLARFQLWTTNIRVFSTGRDSLDYRLRDVPDVQTSVIGLLQALEFRVKTCSRILDSILINSDTTPIEESVNKFVDSLHGVSSEIALLHKITNTIRRASKDTQDSRAAEGFTIRDDEGNDAGPFLQQIFANYVHDRFPGTTEEIRQRLASSMVLRRKRLLYRQERYGKKPIQVAQTISAPRISHPEPDIIKPLDDGERPAKRILLAAPTQSVVYSTATATTLSPEKFKKAIAPSVVSFSKTVNLSNNDDVVFPPAPTRALTQRYEKMERDIDDQCKQTLSTICGYNEGFELSAPTAKDRHIIAEVKSAHDRKLATAWNDCIEAVAEVTCPYCFHVLPVREVIDEQKWNYHVKNDLEPYVCLFETCHSSGHLYAHSNTWIKHMTEHALRWRCASRRHGEFVTDSKEHYLDHMKNSHSGVFTDAQLGVLADQNGRTNGPLFNACPLCGEEKENSALIDHLVGHMRSLAIKSLPPSQEDTNDFDAINVKQHSWGSSLSYSRSTIKNASTVDLNFSDTRGSGQFSEDPFIPSTISIAVNPSVGFDQPLRTVVTSYNHYSNMYHNPIPLTGLPALSISMTQYAMRLRGIVAGQDGRKSTGSRSMYYEGTQCQRINAYAASRNSRLNSFYTGI
ncbi:hypothetical protein FMEXI_9789 [Fusarium mexicanum]|uniref:C2H2-type domain-containing protein n=1 Tax=Fusarium mexicanum TaxID=751941 RepID=A0A8H5IKG9_9HYPO|nr:hypothetical protein FMEXI_9789 [Fusarium mexicanum]